MKLKPGPGPRALMCHNPCCDSKMEWLANSTRGRTLPCSILLIFWNKVDVIRLANVSAFEWYKISQNWFKFPRSYGQLGCNFWNSRVELRHFFCFIKKCHRNIFLFNFPGRDWALDKFSKYRHKSNNQRKLLVSISGN